MLANAIDLRSKPLHISSIGKNAEPAVVLEDFNFDGASFEQYIDHHCSEQQPGRIMMIEASPRNWDSWERHTQGEEIVIVLSGKGEFIQDIDGVQQRLPVEAGSAVINPAGVWHTANIETPINALYITPCPGTEHKPR
ncbi:MAG: cupin domain-containing protein [Pseudomonadales bacterium]|jgi:mannose-6-phosphate isomerase-like protein (cupin superfamily)|nr:cupin domain-containing protein [Pseudomonadales bacterium]